jgi:hypothetical protein
VMFARARFVSDPTCLQRELPGSGTEKAFRSGSGAYRQRRLGVLSLGLVNLGFHIRSS